LRRRRTGQQQCQRAANEQTNRAMHVVTSARLAHVLAPLTLMKYSIATVVICG
jgi:hypothetical protein